MRWNPQIAPTSTGGIYVAWDQADRPTSARSDRGSATPDTTPPGPVTSFTATAAVGPGGVDLDQPDRWRLHRDDDPVQDHGLPDQHELTARSWSTTPELRAPQTATLTPA